MFDFWFLKGVSESLRKWAEMIIRENKEFDQQEKDALTAFYMAVNETRLYLGSIDRNELKKLQDNERRDYEEETRLSRLWTVASEKIAPFNTDLADRCFLKGDYWAAPDSWTSEQVNAAKIEIKRMFETARKLIKVNS